MKKILSGAFVLLLLAGCGGNRKKQVQNNDPAIIETVAGEEEAVKSPVAMDITPDRFDSAPEKLSLTITNNTDGLIQFGADFEIERYTDGGWVKQEFAEGIAFIAIMYGLEAGGSETYDIYIYPDLMKYGQGKYRIRKNIAVGKENQPFYAEFTIGV